MISVHWIPTHRGQEDAQRFARWQPPFVKIVSLDERPPYTEDVPPGAKIIIRNHPLSELYGSRGLAAANVLEDSRYAWSGEFPQRVREPMPVRTTGVLPSPEATGAEHAAICNRMAAYCESKGVSRTRLLFEGLNEPQLWANEPPAMVARYYKSFLNGLHGFGLHGVVGNFGVGWPGNGGVAEAPPLWAFFSQVIAIMQPGDYLGLHEYWALNGPQQNWGWWAGRFLKCPYKVPILITECGIDTGVAGTWYGGWRDLPESTYDAKAERYCNELWWYAKQCANDGRVKGIFPFTYDLGSGEWFKFDIRDTVFMGQFFKKLAAEGMPQPGVVTPPPPPPPPPPVSDPVQVLRNAAWNRLGIAFNPDAAFGKYAREQDLGNPVTGEFDVSTSAGDFREQGFAGGIVYCKIGDWANVQTMAW